jgi:hypothetical protein
VRIVRKLFVVPLAENDHGKSTIVRAMVSQGIGQDIALHRKGVRALTSPWGRPIDAYVFGRSFQEIEKNKYKTVEKTLNANDSKWFERELIVMPSHVVGCENDTSEMIDIAHSAGFDAVGVSVLLSSSITKRLSYSSIWRGKWDERWTIPNPQTEKPGGQLDALGRDLWVWICQTMAGN